MPNDNPFPESSEKDFLRRFHLLHTLADYHESVGRSLGYFGLPSAEMRDVSLWRPLLGHVTAVERDTDLALQMYRTAQKLGIREKTTIIEMPLAKITKFLVMEDKEVQLSLSQLHPSVQNKINLVRRVAHDVINLDLCGGFLYRKKGESENARVLQNLIDFQARQKTAFILIITFALRDRGKDDYNGFIVETLDHLDSLKIDTSQVKRFYIAKEIQDQPANLRRIRFCLPVYLHKIAFDNFQVRSLGAWYYKTFYHTALFFEPRKGKTVLGKAWPPLDEFKELLRAPMTRLETDKAGKIVFKNLPAPSLPEWSAGEIATF
jgi:hypothetical protein